MAFHSRWLCGEKGASHSKWLAVPQLVTTGFNFILEKYNTKNTETFWEFIQWHLLQLSLLRTKLNDETYSHTTGIGKAMKIGKREREPK